MDIKRATAIDLTQEMLKITGFSLLPEHVPVDSAGVAAPTSPVLWDRDPEKISKLTGFLCAGAAKRGHLNLSGVRFLWLETPQGIRQLKLSNPKAGLATWIITTEDYRSAPVGMAELFAEFGVRPEDSK